MPASASQRQLAKELGQLPSAVAKLEVGDRRLDAIELVRLAAVLEGDPGKLVEEAVAKVLEADGGGGAASTRR